MAEQYDEMMGTAKDVMSHPAHSVGSPSSALKLPQEMGMPVYSGNSDTVDSRPYYQRPEDAPAMREDRGRGYGDTNGPIKSNFDKKKRG